MAWLLLAAFWLMARANQGVLSLPGGTQLVELAPYFPEGAKTQVGEAWSDLPGEIYILSVGQRSFKFSARVAGQETIGVPAGQFQTWRVESVSAPITLSGVGSTTAIKCTYWYAPEVRRTVKMHIVFESPILVVQSNDTYELASLGGGK